MTGRTQRVNRKKMDTRQRAAEVAQRALALARRALPALLLVLVVVGLPYVSYQSYLFAVTSPSFAITQVEVSGAVHARHDALLEVGQLAPGVNIFDIDEEGVAQRITLHPWVARAEVKTRLPGTILLRVEEHQPVAIVLDEGEYLLINAGGEPFKAMELSDSADELLGVLPLISGVRRVELESQPAMRARALEALGVWAQWREVGLEESAPIGELHLDPVLGLSLIVGAAGTEVRLGWGRWEERLARFQIVYGDLIARGVSVDYVLIDQEEEINRVAVGPTRTKDR